MGKAQDRPRNQTSRRKRHDQFNKCFGFGKTEGPRRFDQLAVHLLKGGRERLYGKRQAIKNRRHEQSLKTEWKRLTDEIGIQPAKRTVGTDRHENVESE